MCVQKAIFLILIFLLPPGIYAQIPNLIPRPVSVEMGSGSFTIDQHTALRYNAAKPELIASANFLNACLKEISGIQLSSNVVKAKIIELKIAATPKFGAEGYHLSVTPKKIVLIANTKAGIIYGLQTIFQTLPAIRTNEELKIPAMEIEDYPRFSWRGMHLDVSRHFFSPELVKEYIDLMAQFKMNSLHWHLTDNQGWRIEIKKYPRLTSVGAWMMNQVGTAGAANSPGGLGYLAPNGGYYTQEQIKEIVKYAAARNITIVPELDVPGHSAAAILAYPYLSCEPPQQGPLTMQNFHRMPSSLCPGKDSVYKFLEDVYSEVLNLFPSKYIHIGGDEVDKRPWEKCEACMKLMEKEHLKNVDELQSYFVKRMEKFLVSKGRRLIGWDEILEGGLAPEATVMSWRGIEGGTAAAKMGHDAIMTPGTPLYFDHYQADPTTEPLAIGGFNTLKMVYDYEPVPKQLNETEAKHILGAQANLWTEFIATPDHLLRMVLPRMLALSEVQWSAENTKNWEDFNRRLQSYFYRFDQLGIPYSKGNYLVNVAPDSQDGKLTVRLSTEIYNAEVHFTTNGSDPTVNSDRYSHPIQVDSSVTIKAITVVNGVNKNPHPTVQSFVVDKATGRDVHYTYPISPKYAADGLNTLTDGVRGTTNLEKFWHGISGQQLIATIDLGKTQNVHAISIGFLQRFSDWVMMPQWAKFEVSTDGVNFNEIQTVNNPVSPDERKPVIRDFTARFGNQPVRYVRVTAEGANLPPSHPGAGNPAWIFADEIMVN